MRGILIFFCSLSLVFASLELSYDEIKEVASQTEQDLFHSDFSHSITQPQVIAISDFYNLSDFNLDTGYLATLILQSMQQSKKFTLTYAISGNAINADKMIDNIRQQRNQTKYANTIPIQSLIAPTLSLSARITSRVGIEGSKMFAEYGFVFTITDIITGIVKWDYITTLKKYSSTLTPILPHESQYGKMCSQKIPLTNISHKQSCELAISELWTGSIKEIPKEKTKFLSQYASNACELDSALGCRIKGIMYKYAITLPQDYKNALNLYQKSCTLGDGGGCYNLATLYQNQQGVEQDFHKAIEYYTKACDLGFANGCQKKEEVLKGGYLKETTNAKFLNLQTQCLIQHNATSCYYAGLLYNVGDATTPPNTPQAITLFELGCDLGNAESCYQLSNIYFAPSVFQNGKESLKYAQKSCKLDNPYGCQILGALYEFGEVIHNGISININRAIKYYKQSCDLGNPQSCKSYTTLIELSK